MARTGLQRMGWLPAVAVVALAMVWGVAHANSYPSEVIDLTDSNFEHDTQASTGQTTGVWAVLFTDSTVSRFDRAEMVMHQLAQEEEKEAIFARVDVARNKKLAKRFGDVIFLPCILLFRDRQMYVFDKNFESPDILAEVRTFVESGYANAEPLDVPVYVERRLDPEAFKASTEMDPKTVFWAFVLIIGGLVFQAWAIMNKDKFKPEPGQEQKKEQEGDKKKAGAAAGAEKEGGAAKAAAPKDQAAATVSKETPSKAGKAGKAKAT
ncbi:hypothetical protein HYH02_009554 [Chlamydomonas schloesseri]|uniref:Thioredoxin domain-containing protein n=1 Tax=Chlamydomonas schloesseri TaxID=2026947 RepID=A0A835W9G3_9CHLO|nr:hypothetical protein HYH02_009554 [Chlamydomonas schloesseri]|eukprot:KAG2443143.1 hypothetical protein HYH02_009554 [Chlamydomonas schloesseri]